LARDVLRVGGLNPYPDPAERSERPLPHISERCMGLDASVYHTFDGWPVWDSPSEAVAAAPDNWILLQGALVIDGGRVYLCALDGCADRALAAELPALSEEDVALGHLGGQRFIGHVRDGALVNITRIVYPLAAPES
jgi:hypothetical protein